MLVPLLQFKYNWPSTFSFSRIFEKKFKILYILISKIYPLGFKKETVSILNIWKAKTLKFALKLALLEVKRQNFYPFE